MDSRCYVTVMKNLSFFVFTVNQINCLFVICSKDYGPVIETWDFDLYEALNACESWLKPTLFSYSYQHPNDEITKWTFLKTFDLCSGSSFLTIFIFLISWVDYCWAWKGDRGRLEEGKTTLKKIMDNLEDQWWSVA